MALSGTIYGSAGGGGRTPWVSWSVVERDTTNRRSKIRFTVGSNAVQSTWGTFQGTFVQNGYVYGISGAVTSGVSGAIQTLADEWWNHDAQGNLSITMSLSGSIPGTSGWSSTSLSGTQWVDSFPVESAPGKPSTISFTRTNDSSGTLTWAAPTNTTSYSVWGRDGTSGSWTHLAAALTTRSLAVTLTANRARYFYLTAVGPGGATDGPIYGPVYGKPPTPGKPTISKNASNNIDISAPLNGSVFTAGLEVQRVDTGTTISVGTGLDSGATTVTDTGTIPMTRTYKARRFVGAEGANTRVYSAWSVASDPVLDIWYTRPTLTASVQRATGSTVSPVGTNLRVTTAGEATVMPDNVSMTVRARSRVKGTSTWGAYTNSTVVGATAGAFNVTWNLSEVYSITNAYQVQVQVVDTYGSTETTLEVGVGEVALSLSKTGAGVGKVWESGGATLQVNGDITATGHISSDQDIPWTNIPLSSGWSAVSGQTPQACRIGNVVFIRGQIKAGGSRTSLCVLPVGFRPSRAQFIGAQMIVIANVGASALAILVNTNGVIAAPTDYSSSTSGTVNVINLNGSFVV